MTKIIARIVAQSIAILPFQRSEWSGCHEWSGSESKAWSWTPWQRASVQDVEDRKEAHKQGMGVECRSGARDVEDRKEE